MCLQDWDKALRRATQENDLELLKICIENGADVNAPDRNGYTPLMKAAVWSRFRAACILLNNGANVGVKNKKGQMAFDLLMNNKDKRLRCLLRDPTRNFLNNEKIKLITRRQTRFRRYMGRCR